MTKLNDMLQSYEESSAIRWEDDEKTKNDSILRAYYNNAEDMSSINSRKLAHHESKRYDRAHKGFSIKRLKIEN